MASSGSSDGSIPYSKPDPAGASEVPSSALKMGDVERASDNMGPPGWIAIRCELQVQTNKNILVIALLKITDYICTVCRA